MEGHNGKSQVGTLNFPFQGKLLFQGETPSVCLQDDYRHG